MKYFLRLRGFKGNIDPILPRFSQFKWTTFSVAYQMTVTNFIWDELSDNVLLETDENDMVTAAYHHRPERFGELISQNRSGVERFFHFDGQHSTSDLTASNQKVTDTFSFTAYGEEVTRTGATTNPFGYKGAVGYYTNSDTSDIYVRARTYQPTNGRWLSADPLGFVDGYNLYWSFGVDPSGTMTVSLVPPNRTPGFSPDSIVKVRGCDTPQKHCFRFTLGFEAKKDGFIVQEVDVSCRCRPTCCGPWLQFDYTYYEAFPVSRGDTTPHHQPPRIYEDSVPGVDCAAYGRPPGCKEFRYIQKGTAKFYYRNSHFLPGPDYDPDKPLGGGFTTPGDTIDGWGGYQRFPQPWPFSAFCSTLGGPKSTGSKPWFWDLPQDGKSIGRRSFRLFRSCGCGEDHSIGSWIAF